MSSENTPISTAAIEVDRVVKRQKICASKFSSAVDRLLSAVNDGRDKLSAGGTELVLPELKQHVSEMAINSELHDQTKQLHGAIAKLGKVSARYDSLKLVGCITSSSAWSCATLQALEKAFVSDICKAYRPVSFDQQTLDQVFARDLYTMHPHFAQVQAMQLQLQTAPALFHIVMNVNKFHHPGISVVSQSLPHQGNL